MKTVSEQITDLENTRAAKAARMSEVMQKSLDEGRSTDAAEGEEFDTLETELKTIDSDLVRLRRLEKLNSEKAVPAEGGNAKAASQSREGVTVKNTQKLEPGVAFARFAGALANAKGDMREAARFLERRFGDANGAEAMNVMADMGREEFVKAAVAPATTGNSTWAAPLVNYTNMTQDFIDFLRPQTIIGRMQGLRRVPFNIRVPRMTSGGSAYWVGEGAPKPVTSLAFDNVSLKWTKLATIAVITEELARFSSPSAETIVRDALAGAIIQQMDADFINPANAGTTDIKPASITNGVTAVVSAGGTADNIIADVNGVFAPFIAANLTPANGVWIMSATTALALSLKRDAQGNATYPGLTMNGGTFQGMPVIVSEAAGNIIVLANASDILLADDGQVAIDVSREASLQMADNPATPDATTVFRSLWQDNLIGIRAERFVNWTKARAASVQYLSGVDYA